MCVSVRVTLSISALFSSVQIGSDDDEGKLQSESVQEYKLSKGEPVAQTLPYFLFSKWDAEAFGQICFFLLIFTHIFTLVCMCHVCVYSLLPVSLMVFVLAISFGDIRLEISRQRWKSLLTTVLVGSTNMQIKAWIHTDYWVTACHWADQGKLISSWSRAQVN